MSIHEKDNELIWEAYIEESMTISPAGAEIKNDLTKLLEISFAVSDVASRIFEKFKEFEKERYFKERDDVIVSIDREWDVDVFDKTGTINLNTKGLTDEMINTISPEIEKFFEENNIVFKVKEGNNVIHYNITENNSKSPTNPPEMNLSNANMRSLLNSLGYFDIAEEGYGEIDTTNLLKKILRMTSRPDLNFSDYEREEKNPEKDQFTDPDYNNNGPKIYDSGLDTDRIMSYIKRLEELALWANKNGHNKLTVG